MSSTPQLTNATRPQPNGQSFADGDTSTWRVSTVGAAQPLRFDALDAANSQSDVVASDKDNIFAEGKQKAKEIMAAANNTAGRGLDSPSSGAGVSNGANQANGVPQLSRKRSRDGTRLPLTDAKTETDEDDEGAVDTTADEILLDRYMQRDMLHGVVRLEHGENLRAFLRAKERERDYYLNEFKHVRQSNPGAIFGYGYAGFGNRTTEGKTQIVYSTMRGPPKGRRSRELHISRKDNAQQAEQHEELVPLRLDIELDKLRLRDTFTWNLHERLITPDVFAEYLLEDLKVPPEFLPEVTRQVKAELHDQINNFYPHIVVEDGPLEPGRPYSEHKDEEMRIQIKLNVTIGRITLVDQFEWDINNPLNSPEEFARQMAWENALSGEFTTAIAHSIREQSQLYTKSLYLTNHYFDGRPIEDSELRDSFLAGPIASPFRVQHAQKDWQPYLYEMSEAELERTETSLMREHRAQKRQLNRRGGPALPDLKDRQRTIRSLFVHSVIPGAVETFETTGVLKTRRNRSGRRPGTRPDGDADSSDGESEESGVESPAPSILNAGTARTRGMRGAASAAQAAMRANYGRSQTPDSQMLTPADNRSSRRTALRDESVAAEETMIVRLKIGKAPFKQWLDEYRAKKRASEYPLSGYASQPPILTTPAPARTVLTPAATPRPSRQTPQSNGLHRTHSVARPGATEYDSQGRATVEHWPLPNEDPPAPPPWLAEAIATLRQKHPSSNFEPVMRPSCIDLATGNAVKVSLEAGDSAPAGHVLQFVPRIRCNDCPGRLYTAVPGRVIEEFEVHLRNRQHKDKVAERQRRRSAGSGR